MKRKFSFMFDSSYQLPSEQIYNYRMVTSGHQLEKYAKRITKKLVTINLPLRKEHDHEHDELERMKSFDLGSSRKLS